MSCVLRISAPGLGAVLSKLAVQPYRVEDETAHFMVSDAGFRDLPVQIAHAVAFLERHKADVAALMSLPSAEGWLDFAVADRNQPAQFNRLSPELVCLAGKVGIGLELSTYWVEESGPTVH